VVRNEVIHASIQVGNSVPPIPSLTAVLVLAAALALWRRATTDPEVDRSTRPPTTVREGSVGGRWSVVSGRANILTLYIFLTVAASVPSTAAMSFFFAFLTVPRYLSVTQPAYRPIAEAFPTWYAPPDTDVVMRMYRGATDGAVPWHAWAAPLVAWGGFLFLLILTLYAALALLRRPWMEGERLSYPMVQIPLRLLETDSSRRGGATMRAGPRPLWRDPVMWIGFLLEAGFDAVNMLHTAYPSVPSLGTSFDVGGLFPDRPWSALSPFVISYRPEIFGIGYLMPTDVLLTTALSYLALRLSTVWRVAAGQDVPSTPYDYQELGIGAFLALFGLILYRALPSLRASLREAVRLRNAECGMRIGEGTSSSNPHTAFRIPHSDEPLSARAAWLILLLGTGAMLVWLRMAGLALWLAAAHLLILMAVAIVYARMRAETGAPMIYLFPFWQQQTVLTNFLGTEGLAGGDARSFILFNSLGGLSRGYYPQICAYGAEGMSLAAHARFSQRRVTLAVIAGLVMGLLLGGYLYMTAYYEKGGLLLDGGSGRGGYRIYLATQQYEQLARQLAHPESPKLDRIAQTFLGGGLATAFGLLRQRLLWFPLHPMGFAMASAYGYHLWAPFLSVWALKTLILRLGGHTAYRRLVPLFLGIALGRYLFAGIFWGLMGVFGSPVTQSYAIHFG
jgi:hypothetical protein